MVWGPVSCMLSKLAGSDHVRDREKMVNIKIISIFSSTDLVFQSSFYIVRLACYLHGGIYGAAQGGENDLHR